jgi:signal transduction histidine kinase
MKFTIYNKAIFYLSFLTVIVSDNAYSQISDFTIKKVNKTVTVGQLPFIGFGEEQFAISENSTNSLKIKIAAIYGSVFNYDNKNKWYYLNNKFHNIKHVSYSQELLAKSTLKTSAPSYYYDRSVYLKYRVLSGSDTTWHVSTPGEKILNFPSLAPGSYNLNVLAVDPKSNLNGQTITYTFTISSPWWKHNWVRFFVVIVLIGVVNFLLINYQLNKISFQRAFLAEQESVKAERQRISSEIHDDIGSGLFAINLYADLAIKKRKEDEDIQKISTMVGEISDKIREIIWSTNVENDDLENLLYYTQFQITKLFEHSPIKFRSSIPDDIPDAKISSQARRDIYLIIKEMTHNAIKHSKATNAELDILIDKKFLNLIFKDDGIGIDSDKIKIDSMGLENIKLRIKRLHGVLTIQSQFGTTITVKIPLVDIKIKEFNKKLKKWQLVIFEFFKRS